MATLFLKLTRRWEVELDDNDDAMYATDLPFSLRATSSPPSSSSSSIISLIRIKSPLLASLMREFKSSFRSPKVGDGGRGSFLSTILTTNVAVRKFLTLLSVFIRVNLASSLSDSDLIKCEGRRAATIAGVEEEEEVMLVSRKRLLLLFELELSIEESVDDEEEVVDEKESSMATNGHRETCSACVVIVGGGGCCAGKVVLDCRS